MRHPSLIAAVAAVKRLCIILVCVTAALLAGATASSAATTELLSNGSFESGFSGWTTTQPAAPFFPWTVVSAGDAAPFSAPSPQDGTFDALNGFDGSAGAYTISQQVSISTASTATLTWKDRLQWFMFDGLARSVEVRIVDAAGAVLATPYAFSTGPGELTRHDTGWRDHTVDLSAFAGQTVRIEFHYTIPGDHTGPGQAELDAVSLTATANLPTRAAQCKNGGWRPYGGFKSQGDCVSFVVTGGSKPPHGGS